MEDETSEVTDLLQKLFSSTAGVRFEIAAHPARLRVANFYDYLPAWKKNTQIMKEVEEWLNRQKSNQSTADA